MILGNRSTGWNSNINTYGLDILWFNLFFSGFGFVCLCLCMAEMSSALPFSGGLFGFVRASVGPFFGFMVACTEFMFCMTQMSLKAQRFLSDDDGQLIVIVMFGFCLVVNLIGGRPVFALTSFMGFCIAIMMLIYLFGTLSKVGTDEVSYSHYSPLPVEFTWFNVMSGRPSVGGQFSGIQYLTLLADLMREPKEQLPRVWLVSLFIFMAMSVFVILAAVSQAPLAKSLQKASFPMQGGYARIFELQDLTQMKWVDFPFQFWSIFCLYYCAGKQLLALAQSGLLPPIFKKVVPGSETPYVCYTFTAAVGICMNMYFLYYPTYLGEIKALSSFLSVAIMVACLLSYLVFRRKYSSVARSFVNPLGDFAGICGAIIFCFSPVGQIMYNPTINKMYLVGIGAYWVACAIFFFVYLVHHQKFSEEEKKVMFKAYLINANRKKRLNMLRNNKVGASSGNGSQSDNQCSQSRGKNRIPAIFLSFSYLYCYCLLLGRANSQTSAAFSKSVLPITRTSTEIRPAEEV